MMPGPHARSRDTRGVARLHELALQPLKTTTLQFDRAFLNRCVALWNDLPGEVFGGTLNILNQTSINSYSLAKYNILMGRCLAFWASHCGVSCACAVLQAGARPS